MSSVYVCECGGERQVERFDPIVRPTEWFMRCRACGAMSPSATTLEAALAQGSEGYQLTEGVIYDERNERI